MLDDIRTLQVDEHIEARFKKYRDLPVEFVEEILGVDTIEPYQAEILRDCVVHDRVAWRAGHGVGKSTTLAWILIWFLLTRPFSRVLIVAPAFKRQVGKYLLPEVRKWVRNAERGGQDLPLEVKAESVDVIGYKDWFALAVQASDPGKVEGGHNTSMAILADEAKALSSDVIEALHGTQTDIDGDRLYFMASVPGATAGPFYDTFMKGGDLWALHHTSCHDSGRVSKQWIEERKIEWGEESPVFKARVLGEFPEEEEGQLFRLSDLEAAIARDPSEVGGVSEDGPDVGEEQLIRIGADIARFGSDKTAAALWKGFALEKMFVRQGINTMETAAWLAHLCNIHNVDLIYVDEAGIGAGVVDRLDQLHISTEVIGVYASGSADDGELFLNHRAESFWQFREAVERGKVSLPDNPLLLSELLSIRYEYSQRGKIKIEDKKLTRKRVGHSPDLADACVLGHSEEGADFVMYMGGDFI